MEYILYSLMARNIHLQSFKISFLKNLLNDFTWKKVILIQTKFL